MPVPLELAPAWTEIRTELRRAVGESNYEVWLAPLEIRDWDGSVLVLQGKPGTDSWLANRYGKVVERCARSVLGKQVTVAFAGEPALKARSAIKAAGTRTPSVTAISDDTSRFIPRYTFEQFIIGDGNHLAHAAALAVAEAPGQAHNPLFLHAPPGLGKTHLLHAVANYITAFQPETRVRYTTVEAFTNGFIAALNARQLERFKHIHRDIDVLLIDDVQFLASKAKTEEEFFHTFNAVYDAGRQLVVTCDRLPRQLSGIEDRLRERFEAGLVAHLSAPDHATRVAILRKRAALDAIPVADDRILELIAERVTDNVRSLEGALIRVVAHHSLTGMPLNLELAETVLDEIHPQIRSGDSPSTSTPLAAIQAHVARHFAVEETTLTSASRAAKVSWARQVAIYLVRELTGTPLQAIGEAFGGRSHATVLHACKRVEAKLRDDQQTGHELQQLRAELTSKAVDRSR
jgi:chromosomal replication initiator protein